MSDNEPLGFSQHRSKSYKEAAALPEFVEWCLSVPKPKGKLENFVEYLKRSNPTKEPPSEEVAQGEEVAAPGEKAVVTQEEEDSDEEDRPLQSRVVAAKRVMAAKQQSATAEAAEVKVQGSDDDEEDQPLQQRVNAAKRKAAQPEPRAEASKKEGDASSEDEEEPLAARAAKARKRPRQSDMQPANEGAEEAGAAAADSEDSDDEVPDASTTAMAMRMARHVIALGERGDPCAAPQDRSDPATDPWWRCRLTRFSHARVLDVRVV